MDIIVKLCLYNRHLETRVFFKERYWTWIESNWRDILVVSYIFIFIKIRIFTNVTKYLFPMEFYEISYIWKKCEFLSSRFYLRRNRKLFWFPYFETIPPRNYKTDDHQRSWSPIFSNSFLVNHSLRLIQHRLQGSRNH